MIINQFDINKLFTLDNSREMEEEAEKLRQIRSEAENNLPKIVSPKPPSQSANDKTSADEKSVYVGNVRN